MNAVKTRGVSLFLLIFLVAVTVSCTEMVTGKTIVVQPGELGVVISNGTAVSHFDQSFTAKPGSGVTPVRVSTQPAQLRQMFCVLSEDKVERTLVVNYTFQVSDPDKFAIDAVSSGSYESIGRGDGNTQYYFAMQQPGAMTFGGTLGKNYGVLIGPVRQVAGTYKEGDLWPNRSELAASIQKLSNSQLSTSGLAMNDLTVVNVLSACN